MISLHPKPQGFDYLLKVPREEISFILRYRFSSKIMTNRFMKHIIVNPASQQRLEWPAPSDPLGALLVGADIIGEVQRFSALNENNRPSQILPAIPAEASEKITLAQSIW